MVSEPPSEPPSPRDRDGVPPAAGRAHRTRRIERAVAELVAEHGQARVTVGMVVERAQVSRETFYALYSGVGECYVGAVSAYVSALWSHELAMERAQTWAAFEAGLAEGLRALAEDPVFSWCLFLDAPAGIGGVTRQQTTMRTRIAAALHRLQPEADAFVVDASVAMVRQLIEDHLAEGRIAELADRAPEIVRLLQASAAVRPG
jgi:AcrR family transcriptional regulator